MRRAQCGTSTGISALEPLRTAERLQTMCGSPVIKTLKTNTLQIPTVVIISETTRCLGLEFGGFVFLKQLFHPLFQALALGFEQFTFC